MMAGQVGGSVNIVSWRDGNSDRFAQKISSQIFLSSPVVSASGRDLATFSSLNFPQTGRIDSM
jgi:hypothetical protein